MGFFFNSSNLWLSSIFINVNSYKTVTSKVNAVVVCSTKNNDFFFPSSPKYLKAQKGLNFFLQWCLSPSPLTLFNVHSTYHLTFKDAFSFYFLFAVFHLSPYTITDSWRAETWMSLKNNFDIVNVLNYWDCLKSTWIFPSHLISPTMPKQSLGPEELSLTCFLMSPFFFHS